MALADLITATFCKQDKKIEVGKLARKVVYKGNHKLMTTGATKTSLPSETVQVIIMTLLMYKIILIIRFLKAVTLTHCS